MVCRPAVLSTQLTMQPPAGIVQVEALASLHAWDACTAPASYTQAAVPTASGRRLEVKPLSEQLPPARGALPAQSLTFETTFAEAVVQSDAEAEPAAHSVLIDQW
jgi:hypothetical protein